MQIIIVNVALIGKLFDRKTMYQAENPVPFFVNISLLSKQKIKQFFFKIVIISKGIGYSKPHHFLSKHVLLLGIATHFEGSFKVR